MVSSRMRCRNLRQQCRNRFAVIGDMLSATHSFNYGVIFVLLFSVMAIAFSIVILF
jgi:hypothetical protein